MNKKLLLEDGTEFYGKALGSKEDAFGEVVFTTAMTGYQELLTDPSFLGQILTMTTPMIGNYGLNRDDYEAMKPHLSAFIVKEYAADPSNFRMNKNLNDYLVKMKVPGLYGIDTRKLTRHIREKGAVKGCIISAEVSKEEGLQRIKDYDFFTNHMERASTKSSYVMPSSGKRVVLMDFGMKGSILKELNRLGFHVTVVPFDTDAEVILEMNPDGIMLSNGPGNPEDAIKPIETIKKLIGKVPLFGICMGHQMVALAYGARTFKMKFGHRGGNHPVKNLSTGKIEITSQNHSYAVDVDSLAGTGLELTHVNLLDGTAEGVECVGDAVFSMQYHPESASGPQDSGYLFRKFTKIMEERKNA